MNPMEARILDEFRTIVGGRGLISSPEELHTYECDGLTNFRVMPRAVVLPNSTQQVQAVVRICHRERIPFVARGSGTGLSGGALPVENGIVISLARMNRIFAIDLQHRRKRRGKFRWRALPEVRLYDNACSGPGSCSSRWLARTSWRKN